MNLDRHTRNLDRHKRLKIALIIQDKTLSEFAKELNVNLTSLWALALRANSDRINKAIDETIERSDIIFANYLAHKKLNTNLS